MDSDNIVRDAGGQPVVPQGTQPPLNAAPVDTLPRPAPPATMPATQPAITQETVQSRAVTGTITFDELAAKKGFQSPDDLAKAYQNLESQNKRVEATLSDAMKARQDSFQVEQPLNPDEARTTEDALKIVDSRISKQVNAVKDAFEYKLYLIEHPQDRQFASDAIKVVRENPGVSWEVAFKAAKADSLVELSQAEREKGKQEAYEGISKKTEAQSMHSSFSRMPTPSNKEIIEGIKLGTIPLSEARKYINSLS